MGQRARDIILLLAAAGLAAAAIFPLADGGDAAPGEVAPRGRLEIEGDGGPGGTAGNDGLGDATLAPKDAFHPFWPLVPGATWVYRVEGPEGLVPGETWTVTVEKAPGDGVPGVLAAGFEEARATAHVWSRDGALSTDVLPLVSLPRWGTAALEDTRGALLLTPSRMIEGSVWDESHSIAIEYESVDQRGVSRREPARGTITDRATMAGIDTVVVGAGRFQALRVDRIGRIELVADGRKVLAPMTAAPYRRETAWFAKGVGMVRRVVRITDEIEGTVSFDLASYRPPTSGDGR